MFKHLFLYENLDVKIMSLVDKLRTRYATKKFDPLKKLSADQLDDLLSAVQLSPSSYGLQPYKILVIEDLEIRSQLRAAAYNQLQLSDASQVIVFASETNIDEALIGKYIDNIAKVRQLGRHHLEGLEKKVLTNVNYLSEDQKIAWSHKQAYIALGVLLTAAAELGIDACPMEGFEAGKFDEILGLKEKGLTVSVIAAIGVHAADDNYAGLPKVRRPKEELFIHV